MGDISFSIHPAVHFNGHLYQKVIITEHAQQHYGSGSFNIFTYFVRTLDGKNHKNDRIDRHGNPCHFIASYIGGNDIYAGVPWMYANFRSTEFSEDKSSNSLIINHGSPRKEKQYRRYPEKSKRYE